MNLKSSRLVSVVLPIHNRFEPADESVRTVINQSYRPIELIIIDDCSAVPYTPPSEIYNTKGIDVILRRLPVNKGPGAAREEGRTQFSGDFLCYLDSDDLWDPLKIEKQVQFFMSKPDIGMCYCKTAIFENLPLTGNENLRRRNDINCDEIIPALLVGRPWSTSSVLWTRSSIQRIGRWSYGWTWEDVEYDFRAGLLGINIGYIDEVLCYKRIDPNGVSLSKTPERQAIIQKFHSILEISKNFILHIDNIENKFRKLYVQKFLRPILINLYSLEEFGYCKQICSYMIKISPSFSKKWFFSIFLYVLLIFYNVPGNKYLLSKALYYLSVS